ncbi:hypothetical protein [Rhodococcus sp. NPDC058521]|uniref:hypothetical protein n=1 Tax=Rhodococcus sp. NPDC058521 TaxID=3346536 RepID=UPI003650485B
MTAVESILGGELGKDVAGMSVGKPDASIGTRIKDAFEGSSLDMPPDTHTTPSSSSESGDHDG